MVNSQTIFEYLGRSYIVLVDDSEQLVSKEADVADCFKNFFDSAVDKLNLKCDKDLLCDPINLTDPVDIAIKKFENHPSIVSIRENVSDRNFVFKEVDSEEIA